MNTWLIFVGMFALQFGPYTTDQAVIQRYLTTKDEKAAARSIWTNGLISIPGSFLFFVAGTCLYAFFKHNPNLLTYDVEKAIASFSMVLQHYPHFDFAHFYLGEAYQKAGREELAVQHWRQALELNPEHREARERLREQDGGAQP